MTASTKKTLLAKLKGHVDKIAKERDELRALVEEYQEILESVTEAEQSLRDGIDKLSELL